jgi:vancomycin resistance protein YoaR
MQSTLPIARRATPLQRTPADFAAIFAGLVALAVAGLVIWWQIWHVNRIYTGVTVAGVPVGGLTRAEAYNRLLQSPPRAPLPTVSLAYAGRQWPVSADSARGDTDLMTAVNRAYLVGRADGLAAQLTGQLAAALGTVDLAPETAVDVGQLRYAVAQVAADLRRPARPEMQMGAVTLPAQVGLDVDVEATVAALTEAFTTRPPGEHLAVPLQVATLEPAPALPTAAAEPAATAAPRALVLQDSRYGLKFALDPATLADILISDNPPRADEARLRSILENWADQVYLPARNARLRFDPGSQSLTVLQLSRPGRQLNVDASILAIQQALGSEQNPALLVVDPVAPAVDSNRVAEMGIRELVAQGVSYFAGSSAERVRNIEVAAAKFDGVVIPPGGVFSFNEFVEDVSAANGFEDSLIIWGDRTAVGIGGGVCQVSTTIFRAAYNGGMPLVERYNHGYVVDWYGEPGLDATIFTPSVDFKFRNDTGAHLLFEPIVDGAGGTLTVNLYGAKPDREVYVSEPVISDVVPAPAPLYTVDAALAPGQRKQVDWEKPGMTATVTRTIVEGGATRTETLVSQYQPWKAVYLVGSEADIPASARPTPVPQPTELPATPAAEAATEADPGAEAGAPAQPEATPEAAPTSPSNAP